MNRRRFLSMLGMLPAALALPWEEPIRRLAPVIKRSPLRIIVQSPMNNFRTDLQYAGILASKTFPPIPVEQTTKEVEVMPLDNIIMTEGSFVTHEADEWYPGTLLRLEDAPDYGFGETIRFIIQLDDEDGETWALTSTKMTPRTKLYGWVKAIDPTLLPDVGKSFQAEPLANRRIEVMFEAGEDRERVSKIRAEKKAAGTLQKNQRAAGAAKKPAKDYGPDEAPF